MIKFFDEGDEKKFRKFIMSKITYDQETGLFYNKANGKNIGTKDKRGYCRIWINGKPRLAHRIALLIVTGKMPLITDHINGDRSDNRFVNLRSTSARENSGNQKIHRAGKTPWFCYDSDPRRINKRWRARIAVNGKRKHLGWFATKKQALDAVNAELRPTGWERVD